MSSPDREAEDTRPSVVVSAANSKEDEDVEMADDDPVTDLFGGLSAFKTLKTSGKDKWHSLS